VVLPTPLWVPAIRKAGIGQTVPQEGIVSLIVLR
jgi:hypothetical protein